MRRIRYAAAVLIIVLEGVGPLGGTAGAAFPGGDGKIAFETYFQSVGRSRIFTIEPDGSGRVGVTPKSEYSNAPVWSADGSKIAFVQIGDSGDALMTANADGSGVTTVLPVEPGRSIYIPSWSPDGSALAFCTDFSGPLAVFTVNVNGTGLTKVTLGDHEDCDPTWSPDGAKIALVSFRSRGVARIVTINPDGTGRTIVVRTGRNLSPDWSPDGSHLTMSRLVGNEFDIFTVRVDGTELMNLTNSRRRGDGRPAYSPTGTRIVYSRAAGPPHSLFDLWVRRADGTGRARRLTDTPNRAELNSNWQPI